MGKRTLVVVVGAALLVAGCAALQQARSDYDLGKSAPVAEGELSPREAAEGLVEPIVPFLPEPLKPVAGVLVAVLAGVGTWRRGRKIRLQQPVSANPITGDWGQKVGLEKAVQVLTTAVRGATEVGPEGSGLRRAWKVLLAGATAGVGLASTVPAFRELVAAHPTEFGTFLSVAALVAAVEKEISKVLPVKPAPPA